MLVMVIFIIIRVKSMSEMVMKLVAVVKQIRILGYTT